MQRALFLLFITSSLFAKLVPFSITPPNYTADKKIKILDAKRFVSKDIHELSGLAYRDKSLYAISDQGILYRFKAKISHKKIKKIHLEKEYLLRDKKGNLLKKSKRDSEGLCFYKKGVLISFERKNRVEYFSLKGKKLKTMQLNKLLLNNKAYESPNKGLESVSYSKLYGLVTTPELPLKGSDAHYHTLYAKKRIYKFQAEGAVTDIVFINKNKLLVLLRQFSYFTRQRVSSLVEVDLSKCSDDNVCKSSLLLKMDSQQGWNIDNFEGLTKVGKKRFLMVSDDNDSFFQKTLFVLFEIIY